MCQALCQALGIEKQRAKCMFEVCLGRAEEEGYPTRH